MKKKFCIFIATLLSLILFTIGCAPTPDGGDDDGGGSNVEGESQVVTLTKDTDFDTLESDKFTKEEEKEILAGVFFLYTRPHGLLFEPNLNFTAYATGTVKESYNDRETQIFNEESTLKRVKNVLYVSASTQSLSPLTYDYVQQLSILTDNTVNTYWKDNEEDWYHEGQQTKDELIGQPAFNYLLGKAQEFFNALVYDETLKAYVLDEFIFQQEHHTDGYSYHGSSQTYYDVIIKIKDGKLAYAETKLIVYDYDQFEDHDYWSRIEAHEKVKFYDYDTTTYIPPDPSTLPQA